MRYRLVADANEGRLAPKMPPRTQPWRPQNEKEGLQAPLSDTSFCVARIRRARPINRGHGDALKAEVHAAQYGLDILIEVANGAVTERRAVATEVHVVVLDKHRPIGREHPFGAATGSPSSLIEV